MDPTPKTIRDFEEYRRYLQFLARRLMDARLKGKVDESDIVQETLISAVSKFEQYRGKSEQELLGWLRRILVNSVAAATRHFARARRNPDLEVALQDRLNQSSARLESLLIGDLTSPSQRAGRNEQLSSFLHAMCQLQRDQRRAIELHHLEGLPLAQVAAELNRSKAAVAGLLFRGLKELRKKMRKFEEISDA